MKSTSFKEIAVLFVVVTVAVNLLFFKYGYIVTFI